ncbi:MAG: sugar transferase [Chloroflexi bacterium]|nr:sugar transferase [Chloroflexota bacterium]
MRRNEYVYLVALWFVADAIAIYAALNFAFDVRYSITWFPLIEKLTPITERYAVVIPAAIPLWLVVFAFNRLYDRRYLINGLQEYGKIVVSCTLGILILIVLSYLEPNLAVSRGWLVFCWFFSIIFVSAGRFVIRRIVRIMRGRGFLLTRALIVGANEHAKAIARQFSPATQSGIQVVGFVDDYLPLDSRVLGDLCVLDRPTALTRVACEMRATEAIVVQGAIAWESFMEIISNSASLLNQMEIKLSPGFYEIMATGVTLSQDGFVPLLALEKNRITGVDAMLKNALDYTLGVITAIVVSPLLLLTAILVRLAARGSVFEPYHVLGAGQKPFTTWKFRTHRHEPEHNTEDHAFAKPLYRLGLDKLPQFINVLRGEMSFVGPRPVPVARASIYQEWLPTLLTVKPGLTGPWVVAGKEAQTLEDEIRLDLYYIRRWTIWLDLQILLQTAWRLFEGVRPAIKR